MIARAKIIKDIHGHCDIVWMCQALSKNLILLSLCHCFLTFRNQTLDAVLGTLHLTLCDPVCLLAYFVLVLSISVGVLVFIALAPVIEQVQVLAETAHAILSTKHLNPQSIAATALGCKRFSTFESIIR